jgi:hypothetical protein
MTLKNNTLLTTSQKYTSFNILPLYVRYTLYLFLGITSYVSARIIIIFITKAINFENSYFDFKNKIQREQ